jgi:hypothetical protein
VVAAGAAVVAGASLVAAGAAVELAPTVSVWVAGATASGLAWLAAMVSVWDSAPCCHTRHPSSVAISIFVFILLSPIRLRLVFVLNMSCKFFGGVRPSVTVASFAASDVQRKFHAIMQFVW